MINSLCGGMAMKRENSCSQLVQQTSPKNHHDDNQSNQSSFPSITSSELSKNSNMLLLPNELQQLDDDQLQTTLAPPSLDFPAIKFDLDDRDHDHDHPDAALWDSLLQFEATDFMVMSPMPNADLSPPPAPQSQPQGFNNYMPVHLGTSNPGASSKGKGLSPLHKVFSSVNNQYMQHPESFAVPAIEELFLDYQQGLFEDGGYSNSSTTTASTSNNNSDHTIRSSNDNSGSMIPNSLSFCDLVIRDDDNNTEGDNRGATLSQQLEQERQRERANQPSHLNPLPFASDHEQDSGLQLVHLLLACAEAVSKEEYMVARRYLHHLNRVVSPLGDSMQRVASCFTEALSARLAATLATSKPPPPSFPSNSLEVLKIYQIVYQACPYVKFAHFTANQAIFEAFESEERVHVIDLDILQGYQWPAFMQALSARPGGAPFLRITGVGPSIDTIQETGRCLRELAYSLHVPFEFHAVGEQLEDLEPQMLHRRVGEALAVNSVNRLHRVPPHRLGGLLSMLRDQAPSIVTLVEQEASHNGPYFLGRFLEALHYYSAIFDSLDATFPAESAQRMKVEQYIFAPEIRNIVASEGAERTERHERLDKWRKAMEGKGFRGVPLSPNAVTQSKILLGLYSCDGYRLTEDRGCLLLGWQDRPLIAASAWRC